MSDATALRAALAREHEIVYGYGLVGAHLDGRQREVALLALTAHQQRRDDLDRIARATGIRPPPARPAYATPFPVIDRHRALELAAMLETAATGAAWDLVAGSAGGSAARRLAVGWLAEAATYAFAWTLAEGVADVVALPGQPVSSQPSTTPSSSSS